ncbi:RRM domain-containing protein [Caenorhabditis elegans]|uniref:RRM domain-containing protein n=1 Tax=Caenorhabditis elegans TaxID=6239 RepID=Q17467_CAEEL|nr:RRM domain-containing protein [Caenorhabditis elegans]CAA83221.3 RRM domain-containing protein [Caenorhabditis elegans]
MARPSVNNPQAQASGPSGRRRSRAPVTQPTSPPLPPSVKRVFQVKNLPTNVSQNDMDELFSSFNPTKVLLHSNAAGIFRKWSQSPLEDLKLDI